jgi:3'(2'), 5'-bisphosphate nucleotidase
MSKLLTHLPALRNRVCEIAKAAGEITLDYFEEGMVIDSITKGDGSPVTEADKRAEEYITRELKDAISSIPVIGEESFASGTCPDLSQEEYFWLVDPLDGTKEFINGRKDYTVNIALIQNHAPILGVIFAPARGELFSSCGPGTATRWLEETDTEKPIRVRRPPNSGLTVMASNSRNLDELNEYLKEHKVEKIVRQGSSLKICSVAFGKADLYACLGETCEWDTAAGQAILESAGGEITDRDGNRLLYGIKPGNFNNPQFIAQAKFDI